MRNYTVEYLPDKNIVDIKMKGRINFHIAESFSKEAIRLARENGCSKFLIDHKDTSLVSSLTNLFSTGSELQQFGFKNSDKIAILISRNSKNKFTKETQVGNISWSKIKYFDHNNIDNAFIWLAN